MDDTVRVGVDVGGPGFSYHETIDGGMGASRAADGACGRNYTDGEAVPAKVTVGTTVRVETPGGGGYGAPEADDTSPDAT